MIKQDEILKEINKERSYIITGINGSGKTSLAYEIIKSCIEPKYISTFPNNYPDFHFLKGGKIEEVQELLKKLNLRPFYNKHYVILDNINEMTTEGQNLLLKTLEDSDVMFVITSNNDSKVLKTIFSRCYKISPILLSKEEINNILIEKFPIDDKNYLNKVSILSDGSLGKAIKYVENETLRNLIKQLDELKYFNFLQVSNNLDNAKNERDDIIAIVEQYIKNKMISSNKELRNKYFDLTVQIAEYKKHFYQNGNLKIIYRNIFLDLINLAKLS